MRSTLDHVRVVEAHSLMEPGDPKCVCVRIRPRFLYPWFVSLGRIPRYQAPAW